MSYIPDCRTDEVYNQKYLPEQDKRELCGYDWCVEMSVDNFFDNHYNELDTDDSYLAHILRQKVPEEMRDEYEMECSFQNNYCPEKAENEKRKIITYADFLRFEILQWCECNRNELITSMLDNIDEKQYKKIKAQVDARENKS